MDKLLMFKVLECMMEKYRLEKKYKKKSISRKAGNIMKFIYMLYHISRE